jgi:hypothetical protein
MDECFLFAAAPIANTARPNAQVVVALAHRADPRESIRGPVPETVLNFFVFRLRAARAPTDDPARRQAVPMACRPRGGTIFILP